jgi:tetratricopeptide (TPR) repeat protein
MAECGHPWERNRDLAKSQAKDDRREQGYCLFAAAAHASAAGLPEREVKRLYTRAYGVLTAAGEPEPDLRVWLWPDGGEDARYNLTLARCYLQLGRTDEAERRAERAIWQKLIDAPYLSNHDRAVIENLGMRLIRPEGISGIHC